MKTVVG
jgi:hypothetical protein